MMHFCSFLQIMLSKKKTIETQYLGTSGKYVKKETAKPWSKSLICLHWAELVSLT